MIFILLDSMILSFKGVLILLFRGKLMLQTICNFIDWSLSQLIIENKKKSVNCFISCN